MQRHPENLLMTSSFATTLLTTGILTLSLTGGALAAEQDDASGSSTPTIKPYIQPGTEPLAPVTESLTAPMTANETTPGAESAATPAVSLIGHPVQNPQGEQLGEVDTLLVTSDGQVTAIIVGTGGLMGIGKDRYEIPWSQVELRNNGKYVVVDVAKDQIKAEFSAFEFKPILPDKTGK